MGRTSDARDRLTAAMADLVHRRGYESVGVDEVCRAAGVKKGSFYYFFRSKRDLMLAALDRHQQAARDHVMGPAFSPALSPLARIQRFLEIVGEFEASNKRLGGSVRGCPFGNIAAEMSASDPVLARRADEGFCGMAAVIRGALSDAQAAGELDAGVDLDEAADALVAYFEGLALLAKTRNDPSVYRRLGPRIIQLAVSGGAGSRGRQEPASKRRAARRTRRRR